MAVCFHRDRERKKKKTVADFSVKYRFNYVSLVGLISSGGGGGGADVISHTETQQLQPGLLLFTLRSRSPAESEPHAANFEVSPN